MLNAVEALLPEHRERFFPPTETLSMFLAQALNEDRSCQAAVNESAIKRAIDGLLRCSTHTGGYCKARQRLPLERVRSLVRHTGQWIDAQVPGQWRWQGRPVRLVDGTTVTLPDTPANQASYPQQSSQAAGLGFPIGRIVGVTCLSSGAVLDATVEPFQGKGANEQTLLRSLLDTFASSDVVLRMPAMRAISCSPSCAPAVWMPCSNSMGHAGVRPIFVEAKRWAAEIT